MTYIEKNNKYENFMTLAEAISFYKGSIYVWKVDTKDDDLVKVRKEDDVYVFEPVKSNKGWEI